MSLGDITVIEMEILQFISNNSNTTQGDIAKALNVSVGKVNYLIKFLLEKEYIQVCKEGNRYRYILKDKGMEHLEKELHSTQHRKIDLGESNSKIELAVILLAGKNEELRETVGILSVNNEPLIERTIRLLRKKGIKNIILICGYNKEKYEYLLEDNIMLLENPIYEKTGTMYSLSVAQDYITSDFILLEGDIVFEEKLLDILINNRSKNCVTITNLSNRDDEIYVETKNDYIHNISKDIHHLNKILGELIGVTKISKVVFEKMMHRFSQGTNPYVNYEYMLLDVAETFKVYYEYVPNIIFAEIDNLKQYYHVKSEIEPLLK